MSKTIEWKDKPGEYLSHICPGCNENHLIPMWGDKPWDFNGDMEKPTLSPSLKHTFTRAGETRTCHYFIKDGNIEYCGDTQNHLAGQTVPLPALPER